MRKINYFRPTRRRLRWDYIPRRVAYRATRNYLDNDPDRALQFFVGAVIAAIILFVVTFCPW